MDLVTLVDGARAGRTRDVARLISIVENGTGQVPELMRALSESAGTARVIGITGAPGVGKSTTTSALISALRTAGRRVGVLAVDPSSPFSGGALLGDRIRMQEHATDEGVFIRSMASRGHLGGLSATTPQALRVLEHAGFHTVLIETVGVGQSEIEIAAVADPTIVILNPGAGDAVQAAKAGLLEVADLVVVNKADRDGAAQTVRDLKAETHVPVLTLVAARAEGIDELLEAIDAHRRADTPARRTAKARALVLSLAQSRLQTHPDLQSLAEAVADGRCDPYGAAERLIAQPDSAPVDSAGI